MGVLFEEGGVIVKNPKVIDPPNFDLDEAWDSCREWVKSKGEGTMAAAMGADPGCTSCPACGESYWAWGRVIECGCCGFQFPVSWWSDYTSGINDGFRVKGGGQKSGGMERRCKTNPYYETGFNNPVEGAWKRKGKIDWKSIVGDRTAEPVRAIGGYCERCGEDKEERLKKQTGLCVKCDSETTCRHNRKHGTILDKDPVCEAGVHIRELTGPEPGYALRRPCSYFPGGCPVQCSLFEPVSIEEVEASHNETEKAFERMMTVIPVASKIKNDHKGESWKGTVDCPVCNGILHVSHSGYNGHVHGKCETKDCLSWME